jgi:hypothetical protein
MPFDSSSDFNVASRVRLGNKRAGASAKPQPGETVIDIDRANPILGNPYVLKNHRDDVRRAEVIRLYRGKYERDIEVHGPMAVATQELAEMVGAGKRLMCWCAGAPMNKTCHGVIIAQIARLLAFKCE